MQASLKRKENRVEKTQGDSMCVCLIEEGMTYSLD